jgi:hypothetical protein
MRQTVIDGEAEDVVGGCRSTVTDVGFVSQATEDRLGPMFCFARGL